VQAAIGSPETPLDRWIPGPKASFVTSSRGAAFDLLNGSVPLEVSGLPLAQSNRSTTFDAVTEDRVLTTTGLRFRKA
jgi:hypothetical protein